MINLGDQLYADLLRLCQIEDRSSRGRRMGFMTNVQTIERSVERPARHAVASPIDRVHLARYTLGNLPLEIEILGLFAMQAPTTFAELRGAQTEKAWRDAAHTLKGSARAVGAKRVGDCAERAEALKSNSSEVARLAALEAVSQALNEAIVYIEGLSEKV